MENRTEILQALDWTAAVILEHRGQAKVRCR
jgi:hypothetical protein